MSIDRIVKSKEVVAITGRSLASIWRDQKNGRFPMRRKTGTNSVGYLFSEIEAWMNSLQVVTTENVQVVASGVRRGRKPLVA